MKKKQKCTETGERKYGMKSISVRRGWGMEDCMNKFYFLHVTFYIYGCTFQ
jgi:hypothetical protein